MQTYLFFENITESGQKFPFCITRCKGVNQELFYKDLNVDISKITEVFSDVQVNKISTKAGENLELYKVKNLLKIDLPAKYSGVFSENLFFHMHRSLEITYITEGTIVYITGDAAYEVQEGDFIMFNPNTPHTWASVQKDKPICATSFFFYPSLMEFKHFNDDDDAQKIATFLNSSNKTYIYKKDDKLTKKLLDILIECNNEHLEREFGYQMFIRSGLIEFIIMIMREKEKFEYSAEKHSTTFQKSLDYINRNFCEKITLNCLAEINFMTPNYFSVYFKENMGINFSKYISYLRITKSYEMIAFTDKKIFEIAQECGFSTISNFNKIFVDTYKISPGKLRKQLK